MIRTLIACACLALVPAQAFADTTPTQAAPIDPKAPEAVKCVRLSITGSLVRKQRICRTNAEWALTRAQQNRDANDLVERNRTGTNTQ